MSSISKLEILYIYTVGVNIKFPYPLKKNRCPTSYQRLKKRNRLPFLLAIFRLIPPKSINRRAEVIDELEQNWREEKQLIDEKSINNRRTEDERSTRRAETIDGLKRNGRLEQQKQSTD